MQGLAIVIVMVTDVLAKENINTTIKEYSYDEANADAISELNDSLDSLNVSLGMNGTLAGLMLLGFIFSAFTLGKPLRMNN